MAEQLKADFERAQKFIKAEQYAQAITILKPHAAHPRIAALLTDLEAKRKPSGGILKTVLWIVLVVVVGIVAGIGGYALGESRTSAEYELPPSMEAVFVRVCTANTDLSFTDCSRGVRAKWYLHRGHTQECYNQIDDLTDKQFLDCVVGAGE